VLHDVFEQRGFSTPQKPCQDITTGLDHVTRPLPLFS
jgi:hypothetical protein